MIGAIEVVKGINNQKSGIGVHVHMSEIPTAKGAIDYD